jgi:TolA-binding protein
VRKLEAEVRALQRRVFPGGDTQFFEPEISRQQNAPRNAGGPSTTAVTDILSRLDALEVQIQRLTATSEENSNAIRLLTQRMDAGSGASRSVEQPGQGSPAQAAISGPSDERLAGVQAIAKPQSDDAADDEYSYGFRLWNAGFYPEAQQQLTMFVEQYPNHWRATYGRNLLGRAYLDDGKPRDAAPWFLNNYQTDKTAARAGDSLLYLAEAMIALEDTNRGQVSCN